MAFGGIQNTHTHTHMHSHRGVCFWSLLVLAFKDERLKGWMDGWMDGRVGGMASSFHWHYDWKLSSFLPQIVQVVCAEDVCVRYPVA